MNETDLIARTRNQVGEVSTVNGTVIRCREHADAKVCTECREPVVWADDLAAMRDGRCGDCAETVAALT